MLEDRKMKIKTDLDTAKLDKEDAAALKAEYDAKLKNIEKEAEEILSEARQKALKNEARIVEEAKRLPASSNVRTKKQYLKRNVQWTR